jgi:hypothetical protein
LPPFSPFGKKQTKKENSLDAVPVLTGASRDSFLKSVDPWMGWRIRLILALIIQHTVAVALKLRVCDLIPELLAHTFIFRTLAQPARAIAALFL